MQEINPGISTPTGQPLRQGLLTPVLAKIAGLYLRSQGFAPEAAVEWAPISLQDETEEATARLTRAKAEELERKLAHEAKQEGTA